MGAIRTIKGDADNKPYISLEDLINEVESLKSFSDTYNEHKTNKLNFVGVVLSTLHHMEEEYYENFLFKLDDNKNNDEIK